MNGHQTPNQGTSLPVGGTNLSHELLALMLRASGGGTAPSIASSITTTTLGANFLLRSPLTAGQKAYVASRMGSAPTANQIALAQLQANQRLVDQAKHNLAINTLRALAANTNAPAPAAPVLAPPAIQPRLLESASRSLDLLLKSPPARAHPTNLPVQKVDNAASCLWPSPAGRQSLPLPPVAKKDAKGAFPVKLHQMLEDLEQIPHGSEIASFLPHGKAFAIHKPREFVRHVMPKYFRMSRFSSFQRQLNLYDFHRVTEGVDRGAYGHPLFLYGQQSLASTMKRNKIKGVKKLKEDAIANTSERDDSNVDGSLSGALKPPPA